MATKDKLELEAHGGGFAYWTICDGHYGVWDRGDGIAEISPTKPKSYVTASMKIPVPAGFPVHSIIGLVRADETPDYDATGQPSPSFPGTLVRSGQLSVRVDSIDRLEAILFFELQAHTEQAENVVRSLTLQ